MSEASLPEQPFTSTDLDSLGLTRAQLRRLERAGAVRRLVRGVYAAATLPDTVDLRVAAVNRAVAPGHIVVDRTAAWLHGVDALLPREHEVPPGVETTALRGREPTRIGQVEGHTRDLARRDVMTVHGLPVTTPLRTALDLGCGLRRREALAAMIGLARIHRLDVATLNREARRFRGRRGVVQLRELIPLVDARIESPREVWVWLAIHDAELPMPVPQVWVEEDGVPVFRLDFAYRLARVAVEYDGREAHEGAEHRAYDERRRAWLRARDWTVIVVGAGDFTGDRLDAWLGDLRTALRGTYTNRRW